MKQNSKKVLQGVLDDLPGDKSISHRAIILGSIAEGDSVVRATALGRDNLGTMRIMQQLGVKIDAKFNADLYAIAQDEKLEGISHSTDGVCELVVYGRGLDALKKPTDALDCGNSGTTARLLCGLLASRDFICQLQGDESLQKRPFKRVMDPLQQMGADFFAKEKLPFSIGGGKLKGIVYHSPKASAQVKSAILLAGLAAEGEVSVIEPAKSRDHTERMLSAMGCLITQEQLAPGGWKVSLPAEGKRLPLKPQEFIVPGDFSAAAFFIVAGSIIPGSEIVIQNVGFNPTRIGLWNILQRMGAQIENFNQRDIAGELVVDIRVRSAELQGVEIEKNDVVLAIDEIPVLTVAAAVAKGVTRITGAEELRVKESDRLARMAQVLSGFGYAVEELVDGLVIEGNPQLSFDSKVEIKPDWSWKTSGDHRIAMSGAILEFLHCGSFNLSDLRAVETSFPNFIQCFQRLVK